MEVQNQTKNSISWKKGKKKHYKRSTVRDSTTWMPLPYHSVSKRVLERTVAIRCL